ncbi:Acetylcholine receptor [Dirofilaria immitis]
MSIAMETTPASVSSASGDLNSDKTLDQSQHALPMQLSCSASSTPPLQNVSEQSGVLQSDLSTNLSTILNASKNNDIKSGNSPVIDDDANSMLERELEVQQKAFQRFTSSLNDLRFRSTFPINVFPPFLAALQQNPLTLHNQFAAASSNPRSSGVSPGLDDEDENEALASTEPEDLTINFRKEKKECLTGAGGSTGDDNADSDASGQQNWSYEEQFKQLYELSDDVKRKEWLDDWLGFMHRIGNQRHFIVPSFHSRVFRHIRYDLLIDYNKLVRPINNKTNALVVRFKLKLSQLLDVHEKNQIMTTNVWLQHTWTDIKLKWNPEEYGGVNVLYIPSDMIWIPDIVLYNNADGNYQVSSLTKAKLSFNGTVEWAPPATYKSMCQINVEWFPFDEQTCEMKFGSWTYNGLEVDLKHKESDIERKEKKIIPGIDGEYIETIWIVDQGIDLSDYYPSGEWDILGVPSKRHEIRYPCCESPFIDLTYEIHLRRKTLFYTMNLIIPIVGISFLTALVFYLPSDGGEKISFCISILISLTIFLLLLVEITPSTSLVIPLIGKYLLFTMILVTLSIIVTIITLNVHNRSPTTHVMPKWAKKFFIVWLPKYLFMERPTYMQIELTAVDNDNSDETILLKKIFLTKQSSLRLSRTINPNQKSVPPTPFKQEHFVCRTNNSPIFATYAEKIPERQYHESIDLQNASDNVTFIANHLKNNENDRQIIEDWKYVSMVMDRIFLILFTLACTIGSIIIILRAPTIYDRTIALA